MNIEVRIDIQHVGENRVEMSTGVRSVDPQRMDHVARTLREAIAHQKAPERVPVRFELLANDEVIVDETAELQFIDAADVFAAAQRAMG